ncbi:MAG: PKD domain-containing protein, partial [Bacteroidia bacterium]
MKKLLFLFASLLCLNTMQTKAQGYSNFLNHSIWYESENSFGQMSYFSYAQANDTLIKNITYSKIMLSRGGTPFFVREDVFAKKVFIRTVNDTSEVILYDFSLNVGDTLYAKHGWCAGYKLIVRSINTVNTLSGLRNNFTLSDASGYNGYSTIEGVGCPGDPFLNFFPGGDPVSQLVCNYQYQTQIYDCACGYTCGNPNCNASYTYSVGLNGQVTFTNLYPGQSTSWTFGNLGKPDTTIIGTSSVTVTFPCNGTYTVGCEVSMSNTDSNACFANYQTITITNSPNNMQASATYTAECNGQIHFTNTSIGDSLSYYWNVLDSTGNISITTSTLASPSFTVPINHIYIIELQVYCQSCACRKSVTYTIMLSPPVLSFTTNHSCDGNPVVFTSTSPVQANIANLGWDFGDGTGLEVGLGGNPSHLYPAAGIYTVAFTATNTAGCVGKAIMTDTVHANPTFGGSVNEPCFGYPIKFYNGTTVQNPAGLHDTLISYLLDFGDGFSSNALDSTSHNYAVCGTYTIYVTATSNFNCVSSGSGVINIYCLPTINIASDSATICAGNTTTLIASGAQSYTWSTSATTTSIAVTPTSTTTYSVIGTDYNGCINTYTFTQTVNNCGSVGIEKMVNGIQLKIYPNPA